MEEYVECLVCGKKFRQITNTHLLRHGLTVAQYSVKFPDAELISLRVKRKMSAGTKEALSHPGVRAKMSAARYGKKHSVETKKKISVAVREFLSYPEIRARKSAALKEGWNRPGVRERRSGEGSGSWKGGIAHLSYGPEFDEQFKEKIRCRDHYGCQRCGVRSGRQLHRSLDIHHIDYEKRNNDPSNLVSLCRRCHSKTQGNRGYWQGHFQAHMKEKYSSNQPIAIPNPFEGLLFFATN